MVRGEHCGRKGKIERLERVFTGNEKLRQPTMAQWPKLRRATARARGDGCGARTVGKGVRKASSSVY
jgi:hypothetical protein